MAVQNLASEGNKKAMLWNILAAASSFAF